jgi:histidine triad (HIT) family protein
MNYSKNNVFYKIIHNELDSNKIYEDDDFLVIYDKYPKYEFHALLITKQEFISIDDFLNNSDINKIGAYFKTISHIVQKYSLSECGYKIITNHKKSMGQEIFHFHTHIVSGKKI